MKIIIYTLIVLFFANTLHAQEASRIIKLSAEKYAGMKVYMDSGKVISSYYNLAHPHSTALLFKTAYSNKGSFNFEFYALGSTDINILNRDADKQVKVWQGFTNKLISGQPFNLAISGFVGISSFSVALVPTLLMPAEKLIPHTIFDYITDPRIVSIERVNEVECYKIAGTGASLRGSWIVWISKEDLMIRKAENDRKVKEFNVKATYSYFPYIITDRSVFMFRPNRQVSL